MADASTLDRLYARIPAVDCIPGCTDCCGPIPLGTKREAAVFGPFPLKTLEPGYVISTAMDCPNSRANNCRIHANRPFICRLFGTVEARDTHGTPEARMVCPHGRKPKRPLTRREAADLTAEYFALVASEVESARQGSIGAGSAATEANPTSSALLGERGLG